MHELARHVIHSSEVLKVACNTLLRMVADHERLCREGGERLSTTISKNGSDGNGKLARGYPKSLGQIANDLRYHAAFLDCLKQRSHAFDERLRNEIKLVGFPSQSIPVCYSI